MATCYIHGRIFTADDHTADSFVVENGRFVLVGTADDVQKAYPKANVVDLHNQFVCPGFNDSHIHLLHLGTMLSQAQLAPVTDSLAHVLEAFSDYVTAHQQETWLQGHGWNHDYFTDEVRFPTREDLDRICSDRPCLITRACGHVAVANSYALALCGIDQQAHPVDGGRIAVDASGRPTGVLEEKAIDLVSSQIPEPTREQIKAHLLTAMSYVNRFGITSVHSDDFSSYRSSFEEVIAAYRELEAEGRMTVRVNEQCFLPNFDVLNQFLAAGYCTGWGDEWFRIGPLKLLSDGSLGAHTAYLREPYSDMPDTRGIPIYTREILAELIRTAHRGGMQIAVHAIGDQAADDVLFGIETALTEMPRHDARHGIVHAQVTHMDQVRRMADLHMHAYIQPIFLDYDTKIVVPRLGNRANDAYPAASLAREGVTFSAGSDCPVEQPHVLMGIQCAVTRKPVTREADAPYLPREALTLRNALRSFCVGGAYASFEEHQKGCIASGMLADFTVLGVDPFEIDPAYISKIPVRQTFVGGTPV